MNGNTETVKGQIAYSLDNSIYNTLVAMHRSLTIFDVSNMAKSLDKSLVSMVREVAPEMMKVAMLRKDEADSTIRRYPDSLKFNPSKDWGKLSSDERQMIPILVTSYCPNDPSYFLDIHFDEDYKKELDTAMKVLDERKLLKIATAFISALDRTYCSQIQEVADMTLMELELEVDEIMQSRDNARRAEVLYALIKNPTITRAGFIEKLRFASAEGIFRAFPVLGKNRFSFIYSREDVEQEAAKIGRPWFDEYLKAVAAKTGQKFGDYFKVKSFISALRYEESVYRKKLLGLDDENAGLSSEIEENEKRLLSLSEELAKLRKANERIPNLEKKVKALSEGESGVELDRLRKESEGLRTANKQIPALNEKILSLEGQLRKACSLLKKENTEVRTEKVYLREMEDLGMEIKERGSALNEMASQNKQLSMQLAAANGQLEEARKMLLVARHYRDSKIAIVGTDTVPKSFERTLAELGIFAKSVDFNSKKPRKTASLARSDYDFFIVIPSLISHDAQYQLQSKSPEKVLIVPSAGLLFTTLLNRIPQ